MSHNVEFFRELSQMDRGGLINLLLEKDKQIQDLERLVDDQKRLRLQDSNQVEEKAAKIKEWVTKKLKELENQNKQLRDQNKKQKETVDSLSTRLASMSPMSSPRHCMKDGLHSSMGQVHYIDQHIPTSIVDTIDVNQSLKTRRPQLKHRVQLQEKHSMHIIDKDNNNQVCVGQNQDKLCVRLDNSLQGRQISNNRSTQDNISIKSSSTMTRNTGVSLISIGQSPSYNSLRQTPVRRYFEQQPTRTESPLYDTVHIDPNIRKALVGSRSAVETTSDKVSVPSVDQIPPPLPLHQSDKWEQQLYDLAEQTFSSLTNELEASCQALAEKLPAKSDSFSNGNGFDRKSSIYLKESLKSFAKPSFTTIDGDQVVDEGDGNKIQDAAIAPMEPKSLLERQSRHLRMRSSSDFLLSSDRSNSSKADSGDFGSSVNTRRMDDSCTNDQQAICKNLFSPMRSRSGKDSILRTQSVKKNPAPEKLYDYIAADLVKRGYLIKHGALRSHQRWFVLKNFHLYTYKRESDEADKSNPSLAIKLEPQFQLQVLGHSSEGYSFKISYPEKQSLTLIAESAQVRDDWIRMLTVAINMSDIEPSCLTKENSLHEGIVTITKQGHTKKCYAILANHVVFFLKSPIDPTPTGYISVKAAKIREVLDNRNYNQLTNCDHDDEHKSSQMPDCSLAIYARYSLNLDPTYITLGNQQETDAWFYQLSLASGLDQSSGTKFERALTQIMLNTNIIKKSQVAYGISSDSSSVDSGNSCMWRENSAMLYSDKPIPEPLTTLPNETLRSEAVELFKSILLFTQAPIEPIAIDYHVCLLQNCLGRMLKHPELKNEFYAQLIKQSTFVLHRCFGSKLSSSSSSSGCSSINQRASLNSLTTSSSECQLVTDLQLLDAVANDHEARHDVRSTLSHSQAPKDRTEASPQPEEISPPSRGELLQVMQIIALAVSLNIPQGRVRWWLIYHLHKFANHENEIGKYALFAIRAIDRTLANGIRDNVPSRTEIMSILLRNPYDHSTPHSLPINFEDDSYLIVGVDGSTTTEEFLIKMGKQSNVRSSELSDFYLFANDPTDAKNSSLHILEPQRKILDVVGWWEQTFKQQNSGRYQNTRVIKIYCKKRLVLRQEEGETDQERLLIVHQLNNDVVSEKIPISDELLLELGAVMAQLTFGCYTKCKDDLKQYKCAMEKLMSKYLPLSRDASSRGELARQVEERWNKLSSRTPQDCVRVYLNCIRKLKL